jgi:hypothetical protein
MMPATDENINPKVVGEKRFRRITQPIKAPNGSDNPERNDNAKAR